MPVSAVGARGGIGLCEVVCVESAVALETLSESVDVVRVPNAGDKVRLRALQKADLVWKAKRERIEMRREYSSIWVHEKDDG